MTLLDPIPPGEILLEEFMKPIGISEIVNGKRSITADTALRLGKYFSVSPEIWLDLQSDYDIRIAPHLSEDRAAVPDARRMMPDGNHR